VNPREHIAGNASLKAKLMGVKSPRVAARTDLRTFAPGQLPPGGNVMKQQRSQDASSGSGLFRYIQDVHESNNRMRNNMPF